VELKDYLEHGIDSALGILQWAFKNMWSKKGYFYYQKTRFIKNRVPYMRWSQAWMLFALSTLFEEYDQGLALR
jgi:hypothetical protein